MQYLTNQLTEVDKRLESWGNAMVNTLDSVLMEEHYYNGSEEDKVFIDTMNAEVVKFNVYLLELINYRAYVLAQIEECCNIDSNTHTQGVHTVSITMTKVPFNSYIDALNRARDTDERVRNSLSTPAELTAKVQIYHREKAEELGKALSAEEFHSEYVSVRVAYRGTEPVAGYLVIDGELVGLFSLARGKVDWIMGHAVSDGAVHLDCFAEPALLKLYHKHGFIIYHSEANYDPAGLPVVFMSRTAN